VDIIRETNQAERPIKGRCTRYNRERRNMKTLIFADSVLIWRKGKKETEEKLDQRKFIINEYGK
jgi:hypothetical protein